MFPISDSITSKKFPFLTISLIAANVYVFIQELVAPSFEVFVNHYALVPSLINISNFPTLLPFVTALFLHGGFFHIISNMWFLWIFGDDVEEHIGYFWYLALFLGAGIVGNAVQYLLGPTSSIPILGASGAVSGILGAYYILFPHSKIKTLLFIFFFVTVAEIPAVVYLFYWFIIQIFQGAAALGSPQVGGVAFWAHVGGFVTGILFGKTFQNKVYKGYIEGEIVE